jgi:formate hydrogenlyase transcriptional activator
MILATGPVLFIRPPGESPHNAGPSLLHSDAEREHLRSVLEKTGWRACGKDGAAEILGLKPTTLDSMMVRLGLTRRPSERTG